MYAYNPRKKTFQQLKDSMVGSDRWDILHTIMQEMDIKREESPKQHWLIIGPRGIGKSHLLTLLYYEVKNDPKLHKKWIPILFPEELRMAGTLGKFLERTLTEILLELEQPGEKNPMNDKLKEEIKRVKESSQSEKEKTEGFLSLISWVYRETGKHLLLLPENLQELLGTKFSLLDQKRLRSFLQSDGALLLIGSGTTVFDALHDHSHPFYHFFNIWRLKDLSFDCMRTLMEDILSRKQQQVPKKTAQENIKRIKALYTFTGGNPRTAIFLADILNMAIPGEMLEIMDRVLDELTPYFESVANAVPDYLEEVLNTLASFEPAQNPGEIAAHLAIPQTSIRNYLKLLKEEGYVRIAFSKGKSNYYCLNEYLYRLWFQMRDGGHRDKNRWLIELLLMLYSKETLLEEKTKLDASLRSPSTTSPWQEIIHLAIQSSDNYPKHYEFMKLVMALTESDRKDAVEKSPELEKFFETALNLLKEGEFNQLTRLCEEFTELYPHSEYGYLFWGICLLYQDLKQQALNQFRKAIRINPKSTKGYAFLIICLLEKGEKKKALEQLKKLLELNPGSELAHTILQEFLAGQKPGAKILKEIETLAGLYTKSVDGYWFLAIYFKEKGNYEEAIENLKKLIRMDANYESAYGLWGECLMELGRYEEAIEQFEKYKFHQPDPAAIFSYGEALMKVKRTDDALGQFEKLMEIKPGFYHVYLSYAQLLESKSNHEDALRAYLLYVKYGYEGSDRDFDFKEVYHRYIVPLLDKLEFEKYIKEFYDPPVLEKNKLSQFQVGIILMMLSKYDLLNGKLQEMISSSPDKNNGEKNELALLVFTFKFCIWLELSNGNFNNALKISCLYIEYIKTIEHSKDKENEVMHFCLDLFSIQIKSNIDSENIKKVLKLLEEEEDIPFNDIIFKVWTCLSDPGSVEALRYLNEKAIAELVKKLKATVTDSETGLSPLQTRTNPDLTIHTSTG
jgi:tetratricopeptide (TPR) repeat protein